MYLQIVSPFTHLMSHDRAFTIDLIRALKAHAPEIDIHLYISKYDAEIDNWIHGHPIKLTLCTPAFVRFLNRLISFFPSYFHLEKIARNIDFYFCLKKAVKTSNKLSPSHIHCIESCHNHLIKFVLNSNSHFSTLCVGSISSQSMTASKIQKYRSAFNSGKLDFIVETEHVKSNWSEISTKHVHHIPTAIPYGPVNIINVQTARDELDLPIERPIYLCFGTHRADKDYHTVVKAAKRSQSQPYLLFVGPLISDNNPQNILSTLKYKHGDLWNKYYPENELPTLFGACDAIILPYPSDYMKGSGVLLQACQYLKPVIATQGGFMAEFIHSYGIGYTYESGNPSSLATKFDQFSGRTNADVDELEYNLAEVRRRHDWSNLIDNYIQIFSH